MKKMFILFAALIAFSGVFAQYDNHSANNRNTNYNNHNTYNQPNEMAMAGGNDGYHHDGDVNNNRRPETERVNRDYDRQADRYRNDRNMNRYGRDRHIGMIERERNNKLKMVAGSVLVGGLIGVLIGSNL